MNHPMYLHVPSDDFEEEPEDELASAGMHVVESGKEDADLEDEKPAVVVEAVADEEEADEAPDGLAELEKLEKEVTGGPLTFGDDDGE